MDSAPSNRPEYSSQTDVELWFALRSGQSEALGQIYDRHAGLIYGISLKVLGNTQEAEDLTQDIFVKLVQQASYDPERGSLRTFLMVLTRSRAIDRVRSRQSNRKKRTRWQADYLPPTPNLSAYDMARDEQSHDIRSALAQLSDQQQQVLYLAYYEGFTQAAIADHLNAPLGTIKARARRGLLRLREILQDQQQESGYE